MRKRGLGVWVEIEGELRGNLLMPSWWYIFRGVRSITRSLVYVGDERESMLE